MYTNYKSETEQRRGGISFEKTDKNAIYVRTLADVRAKPSPESSNISRTIIHEPERKILDKLSLPGYKLRFRSRFLSLHKVHRRRKPILKVCGQNKVVLDADYGQQTQCMLTGVGDWNFNIFSLDVLSGGRALFHIGLQLFQEYDLIRCFRLDILKLMRCLSLLESGYNDNNCYHNAVHAADVTQAMHCFFQERKLRNCLTPLEVMAAFIGSMSHDLDHPGVNNTFLIATENHLGTLYNNTSILENHHWRSAVGVLQETSLFRHLQRNQWESLVQQIKSLILATDITRQQEFLQKFRSHLDGHDFDTLQSKENRLLIMQIALKCADICNPCRNWPVSKVWSERVVEEFFKQGDAERTLHIPVTPLCNRKINTVAKIQAGFMEFVALPLFTEWHRFLPSKLSKQMLQNIAINKVQWTKILDEEARVRMDGQKEEEDEEEEETEERDSEEDDIVSSNDVNLVYHYDSEQMSEGGRSLSPVSEDVDASIVKGSRRHSMPPVFIRKDLNFYLGIRRGDSSPKSHFLRRQSLPTTSLLKSTSIGDSVKDVEESRSVSMDELLSQPNISTLSRNSDTCRVARGLEYLNFVPLQKQTLVLQNEKVTTSLLTFQTNSSSGYRRCSLKNEKLPHVGLASSWPTVSSKGIHNNNVPHGKLKPTVSIFAHEERSNGASKPSLCLSDTQQETSSARPH